MILHPIIDLLKRIVVALPDYGGGGTSITDGIVFTSVDENGRPITADIYGINIPNYCFGSYNGGGVLGESLRFVNFKSNPTQIGTQAFAKTAIEELIIPDSVQTSGGSIIRNATGVKRIVHKNAGSKYGYSGSFNSAWTYSGASYLEEMILGDVGKPVTAIHSRSFNSFGAPSTAIIKIYCLGDYVDSALTALRGTLTSQKIIFYASENTTYNGTTYNAGDTILTSEVTA